MPCTRQGAKVRPLRGRSLRRALQVKAGVRPTIEVGNERTYPDDSPRG